MKTMNSTEEAPPPLPRRRCTVAAPAATPCSVTLRPSRCADDALHAGQQPGAVVALPELRRHVVAADLAGEAVGDELLEVVADLDPHPPVLDGHQDEQRRCPCPSGRCRGRGSRTSSPRTRRCRAYGCERLDGGDDDDVAAGALQRADERVHRAALSRSMTPAKSLTGCVSAGGSGCAARRGHARQRSTATSGEHADAAAGDDARHAARHRSTTAPAFDGGQVVRETAAPGRTRDVRWVLERQDGARRCRRAGRPRGRPAGWLPSVSVWTPCSRATFRSSAANAGARRRRPGRRRPAAARRPRCSPRAGGAGGS